MHVYNGELATRLAVKLDFVFWDPACENRGDDNTAEFCHSNVKMAENISITDVILMHIGTRC